MRRSTAITAMIVTMIAGFTTTSCQSRNTPPTAGSQSTASASTDTLARFCELARERNRNGPDINFDTATTAQVRAAFNNFVTEMKANIDESIRLAPADIRTDFIASIADTRQIARTGSLAYFSRPEYQRVGQFMANRCGIRDK